MHFSASGRPSPWSRFSTIALLLPLLSTSHALPAHLAARQSTPAAVQTYDYIVLGGGTSGLVLAYRLAAGLPSNASILLLESGAIPADTVPASRVSAAALALQHTPLDWNLSTTNASGNSIAYPQGRGLGGSSAMGYMTYTSGPAAYFDALAEMLGDQNWSSSAVASLTAALSDSSNPDGVYLSLSDSTTLATASINSHLQDGMNSAFSLTSAEKSDGAYTGTTRLPLLTVSNATGWRETSWTAFGEVGWGQYFGLNVVTGTTARRLLFTADPSDPSKQRVTGVVADSERDGQISYNLSASGRVLLSAGVVGSPRILLQSGVGDSQALAQAGIQSVLDLPGVGRAFQDHVKISLRYTVAPVNNSTGTADESAPQTGSEVLLRANPVELIGATPLSSSSAYRSLQEGATAYLRSASPNETRDWPDLAITASGPANLSALYPSDEITLSYTILSASSRGSIALSSSSDSGSLINGNFLSETRDESLAVEGFRMVRQLAEHVNQLGQVRLAEATLGISGLSEDAEILDWIRQNHGVAYNGVGTLSMLPLEQGGVVDNSFQVYNTTNLHVVDASVVPLLPPFGAQSLAYLVAEKASRIILQLVA